MVWYFIVFLIINRALHGRLEIRNFPSSVEKYFTGERNILYQYLCILWNAHGRIECNLDVTPAGYRDCQIFSLTGVNKINVRYKVLFVV